MPKVVAPAPDISLILERNPVLSDSVRARSNLKFEKAAGGVAPTGLVNLIVGKYLREFKLTNFRCVASFVGWVVVGLKLTSPCRPG